MITPLELKGFGSLLMGGYSSKGFFVYFAGGERVYAHGLVNFVDMSRGHARNLYILRVTFYSTLQFFLRRILL